MKWLANWKEEIESQKYVEHEKWLTNWTEAIKLFNEWADIFNNTVKGEITCYWDNDKIYGDGRPCIVYDITDDNNDNYEDEDADYFNDVYIDEE